MALCVCVSPCARGSDETDCKAVRCVPLPPWSAGALSVFQWHVTSLSCAFAEPPLLICCGDLLTVGGRRQANQMGHAKPDKA